MKSLKELCNKVDSYKCQHQHSNLTSATTVSITRSESEKEEENKYELYKKACERITEMLNSCREDDNYGSNSNDNVAYHVHTLCHERLLAVVAQAESEMKSVIFCQKITVDEQIAIMTNYVKLFIECSKRTTLPQTSWAAAHEIVETIFKSNKEHHEETGEEKEHGTKRCVEHKRVALLNTLQEWCAVCWWGTHIGLEVELSKINAFDMSLDKDTSVMESSSNITEVKEINCVESILDVQQELLKQTTESVALEHKKVKLKNTDALALFTTRYFSLLHKFNAICHQYRHLFDLYGNIGLAQRNILYTLLTFVSDCGNSVNNSSLQSDGQEHDMKVSTIEAIIRQTFRRDSAVPSLYLCSNSLQQEYKDFEVDEKKQCEMEKIMSSTLLQVECTQAINVYNLLHEDMGKVVSRSSNDGSVNHHEDNFIKEEELLEKSANEESVITKNKQEEQDLILSKLEKFNTVADVLVQTYMTSTPPSCYLAALSFTFYRMLEVESSCNAIEVNLSRIEFVCSILHKWLVSYIAREHRWTVNDTFANQDDTDMWRFILDRHTALLRIGLSSVSKEKHVMSTKNESVVSSTSHRLSAQINIVRHITFSLLHCWHKYVELTNSSRANDVKKRIRLGSTLKLIRSWVKSELISVFGQSLLNDINDADTDNDNATNYIVEQNEENEGESLCLESKANRSEYNNDNQNVNLSELERLMLEAELKLIITETQLVVWSSLSETIPLLPPQPSTVQGAEHEMIETHKKEENALQQQVYLMNCNDVSYQIFCIDKDDVMRDMCNRLDEIVDACITAVTETCARTETAVLQPIHVEEMSNAYLCVELVIRLLHQMERVYEMVRQTVDEQTHENEQSKTVTVNTTDQNANHLNAQELHCHVLNMLCQYYRKVVHLASSLPLQHITNAHCASRSCFLVELASDGWCRCIARQASWSTRPQQKQTTIKGKNTIAATIKGASFVDAVIERRKAMKRVVISNHVECRDSDCSASNATIKRETSKRQREVTDDDVLLNKSM